MRYPVYVPSKGRYTGSATSRMLTAADVPHSLVVEPAEVDLYRDAFPSVSVLSLPADNRGITYARNWIKDHAAGHARHWQFDDNIYGVRQWDSGTRNRADPGRVLSSIEDFVDRYRNVGIAGLQNTAFGQDIRTPFSINQQVYCAVLVRTDPLRWRGQGGSEDTDYSLQVLASGDCTILFRYWQIEKQNSGTATGGNTDFYENDGRARRARELAAAWPGLVTIRSRWGRPVADLTRTWRKFDQQLEPIR